jgi:hypothetical protein
MNQKLLVEGTNVFSFEQVYEFRLRFDFQLETEYWGFAIYSRVELAGLISSIPFDFKSQNGIRSSLTFNINCIA